MYIVQTLLRPGELLHLDLTADQVTDVEAPRKLVAPHNSRVVVGGLASYSSGETWSHDVIRPRIGLGTPDLVTNSLVSPVEVVLRLTLAEALIPVDELGDEV